MYLSKRRGTEWRVPWPYKGIKTSIHSSACRHRHRRTHALHRELYVTSGYSDLSSSYQAQCVLQGFLRIECGTEQQLQVSVKVVLMTDRKGGPLQLCFGREEILKINILQKISSKCQGSGHLSDTQQIKKIFYRKKKCKFHTNMSNLVMFSSKIENSILVVVVLYIFVFNLQMT